MTKNAVGYIIFSSLMRNNEIFDRESPSESGISLILLYKGESL